MLPEHVVLLVNKHMFEYVTAQGNLFLKEIAISWFFKRKGLLLAAPDRRITF